MTERNHEEQVSVLLPAASVGLFVLDPAIKAVVETLPQDWRFARVSLFVRDGGVADAISYAGQQETPDLLIIETDDISDAFLQRLDQLADKCSPNTSAVIIGPVNDVYLYRRLVGMGASDYLVKPVARDVFVDVIARTLIEKKGLSDSQLIAVIGTRGGTGASSIAGVLGRIFSSQFEQKTILMDAAGGWSYLAMDMGVEPTTNFLEVARASQSSDSDSMKRMIYAVDDKLSVLATGADSLLEETVQPEIYEYVLNRMMIAHPLAIVDLSGASHAVQKMVLTRAHAIVLVTTPSLPALRITRGLMADIRDLRGGTQNNDMHLVLNMTGQNAQAEVSKADIEKALDAKIALSLAHDSRIFPLAQMQGKSALMMKGAEDLRKAFTALAQMILHKDAGQKDKKSGESKSGFLGFLLGTKK